MTFQTTRWSLILRARRGDAAGEQALAELCAVYWPPVYTFFRALGADREHAEDLTQGLFADLLQRGDLPHTDPARGRFRSFLRACARHFWANERDRAMAARRGGGRHPLSIDERDTESWFRSLPMDRRDPEALFEQRWARTVIDRALWQLEQDERAARRHDQFVALRETLDGNPPSRSWAELATALDTSEGALKVAAHRLRARFREALIAEVRNTLPDDTDPGGELQELLAALQGAQR